MMPAFTESVMSGLGRTARVLAAVLACTSCITPHMANGQTSPGAENFSACLQNLQTRAQEQGRSNAVLALVPTMEQQVRVLELDRKQPEFMQTFGRYLSIRVNDQRVAKGREKSQQQTDLLALLHRDFGIPGQYLVAFWGLETNFGSYLGNMPTLDSLATLACDPRRSEFFTGEFLIALELLEREGLDPDRMRGSWAGAMGHTQFMPSTWRRYAIDGDNDGRIDLWGSEADALASGANFLSRMGWVRDLRWGREVLLPDGFDYALAGRSQWLPLSEWAELGVSTAGGQALPRADVEAALLVPAGAEGPAFLVYRNFEVIMGWNRSESYALSVGLLANRIAGAPGLVRPPPNDEALHVDQVRALQQALADRGFDPGPADGIWGPSSRAALTAFETSLDRTADGYPDAGVIALLLGSE
jgi:membrane-bound lytic murein transglycosylase B